jgi:hypothetical protein
MISQIQWDPMVRHVLGDSYFVTALPAQRLLDANAITVLAQSPLSNLHNTGCTTTTSTHTGIPQSPKKGITFRNQKNLSKLGD